MVKNAARRMCGQTVSVCDHPIQWQMVHYDVQLIGGIALHERHIAEMATGEGKTLVSTCPLYLNALSGKNCQLVTVNDYLARRDSHWMGHFSNILGFQSDVFKIICHQRNDERCTRRILPTVRLLSLALIIFGTTAWQLASMIRFKEIIIFVSLMRQTPY